jgi:hypothetical protein
VQESSDGESEAAELVNEEADDYVEDVALGSWLTKREVEILFGVMSGGTAIRLLCRLNSIGMKEIIELYEFSSRYSSVWE